VEALEELLVFMFDPKNRKSGISKFPIPHVLDLIQPCVMFVAIMRLEFSWSTEKKGSGRDAGKTEKFWIPRIYIAKASHSERASERFEARLSKRAKLMVCGPHLYRHFNHVKAYGNVDIRNHLRRRVLPHNTQIISPLTHNSTTRSARKTSSRVILVSYANDRQASQDSHHVLPSHRIYSPTYHELLV
jgi:hypothetical protein